MTNPTYNIIGETYDTTRCADPEITEILIEYFIAQIKWKIS